MDVSSVSDLKGVSVLMHDSEFGIEDFGYDSKNKQFHISTNVPVFERRLLFLWKRVPNTISEKLYLELHNVEKYNPKNLDRIKAGKGLTGVFNFIRIRNNGRKLTLVAQDLCIELELSKLEGRFERIKE
jgi:hypothetical protein